MVSSPQEKQVKLTSIISLAATTLGLIYLLLVLVGKVDKEKFGQTEATIFATILILNSSVIEKLEKFQFGKDGVSLELEKKVEEVKNKQDQLKQLGLSNRANIEGLVQFLVRNSLGTYERSHLKKIASDAPFKYRKTTTFETELRRLRDLGLIKGRTEERLSISQLPKAGENLKDYVQITPLGEECLEIIEQAVPALAESMSTADIASLNSNSVEDPK